LTSLTRAAFSACWIWTYPHILSTGNGALLDFVGYRDGFNSFRRPWEAKTSWSRFWAYYQASETATKDPSVDKGWDYMVPLWRESKSTITAPSGAAGETSVLLYPTAIAVVLRVEASGDWTPGDLATHLHGLRISNEWELVTPAAKTPSRSLAGIASEFRTEAEAVLSPDHGKPSVPSVMTVAAPLEGDGPAEELELAQPAAKAALAGLASLSPPGTLLESQLLEETSDTGLGARLYVTKKGHAIWHPVKIVARSSKDPLGCFHRNQTDLAVQIAALADSVSWAHDAITAGQAIPGNVQEVLKRAVTRLNRLEEGDPKKTYRSGLAKARITPMRARIDTVQQVVGSM
jgi:hypothetical protein